jgi:hypothetical protein
MREALDSMDLRRGDAVEALAAYEAMTLPGYLAFLGSPALDPTGCPRATAHVLGLTPAKADALFVATQKTRDEWIEVLENRS